MLRTTVYIDGFNFYYGAIKGTSYKWLNLEKMCQLILPKHTITKIKYFSAYVNARPNDLDQPARQLTYFRALRTLPTIEIILGHFLTTEVNMLVATSPSNHPTYVKVIKTEEKGSDVNLATHLVHDGHKKNYDLAVVITNDSDLLEPIKIVREELGYPIGLLNPHRRLSRALQPHATFIKQIRAGVLAASQFPPELFDSTGVFHKPLRW